VKKSRTDGLLASLRFRRPQVKASQQPTRQPAKETSKPPKRPRSPLKMKGPQGVNSFFRNPPGAISSNFPTRSGCLRANSAARTPPMLNPRRQTFLSSGIKTSSISPRSWSIYKSRSRRLPEAATLFPKPYKSKARTRRPREHRNGINGSKVNQEAPIP